MIKCKYKYSIELFINNQWITEIRYYHTEKDPNDFDVRDIPNKRRNFKKLN
jgi:hypothetical protein